MVNISDRQTITFSSSLEAQPTPMDHVTDRRPGCVESILMLAASLALAETCNL